MPGLRVLEIRIGDLERARERDTESTADSRKLSLGFLAELQIERRSGGETIQDRPQFDGFVDLLESMDALLDPFGDREIDRLNEVATIRLRYGLAATEKIVDLTVDEIGLALEILFVDVEPRCRSEEALESGHAHDMCRRFCAVDRPLRNHDSWIRSTILPSTCPSAKRS